MHYGVQSDYVSHEDALKAYEQWKKKFVRFCGEHEARVVKDDASVTVSEGIGYGLAIAAYAGDKYLFDKFLTYYMARLNWRGLMNWIYEDCETGDNKKNGASDADLDASIGIIVATKQWPHEQKYVNYAHALLDSLQKHNFVVCNDVLVQKPGDDFGGCTCTNPSYYSPGYYRVFAEFKKEHNDNQAAAFWLQAAHDSYITLQKNTHPYTGLVYAWTNAEGGDPENCYYEVTGSGVYNSYQYDACRTPWRIATDYLWWGTPEAQIWTQNIVKFIEAPIHVQREDDGTIWYGAGGIENVVDNYWHNGLRRMNPEAPTYGHRHTVPFVGAFALAAMSGKQELADSYMKDFALVPAHRYYESCLQVLYMFLASGNFWNPYKID
jgi:endo-1,4-beta-D-glucanase Y